MSRSPALLVVLTALGVLSLTPIVVRAEPVAVGGDSDEARRGPSENLCFGGLEDGKIIVAEPYLENPYRQTTHLGCEVDGGAPVTMPDLPAPDAAKTRLS